MKESALAFGLPVLQPPTLAGAEVRAEFSAHCPDAFVVVAYGRLLGPKFRALAPHGAVNVHFSLLPRWRGAAPVQRALLAGDRTTGVSIMRLVDELDAGPVYARAELAIGESEHAPALEERLSHRGAELLVETLDLLERGGVGALPQDPSLVTLAPPLAKAESWLDPALEADILARRVRALDPWPGTRLALSGAEPLGVLEARVGAERTHEAPGTFLALVGDDLPLACGGGSVLLLRRVKPAGKAGMTGRSAINGRIVLSGTLAAAPPLDLPHGLGAA